MGGPIWLWVSTVQAAVWSVKADGTGQFSSIQAAISAASSGDTIEVGPGTWREAISTADKRLSIVSTGGSATTILDATGRGDNAVQAWGDLTLTGLTIQNTGGRGLGIWGGQAHLSDLIFDEIGESWVYGGAMYVGTGATVEGSDLTISGGQVYQGMIYASGAALSFSNLTVDGAEAAGNGAALLAYGSTITIDGGALERLYAVANGGAMFIAGSTLTLKDVEVYGNLTDYGNGTGLYAEGSTVTVEGGRFELNNAIHYDSGYQGGAMYLVSTDASLDGVELTENYAYYGGAIRLVGGSLAITGSTLERNWAYYGGGLFTDGTNTVTLDASSLSDNVGYYGGGALYVNGSFSLSTQDSSFSENEATYGHGGAIHTYYEGSASFTDTTFVDNYAYYNGAGIYSSYTYGTDTYTRCTFEGNESVYGQGAAISANAYVRVSITDSRLAYNVSTNSHAGAIYAYYAPLTITDSTLLGNRAAGGRGGGIYSYYAWGNGSGALQVERVTFQSNEALYQGGAIASIYDDVRLLDSTFVTNDVDQAGMGGAVFLDYTLRVAGRRNHFVGNNAGYGGALYSNRANLSIGAEQWSNNTFQENTALVGGAAAWVTTRGAEVRNNTFVGNAAVETASNVALVEAPVTLLGNAFAHATSGVAVHAYDQASADGARLAHNAFYDIADGLGGGTLTDEALLAEGGLEVDPLFAAYSPDGTADNDRYVLLRDSLLIDAGDPILKDPDGSPSDIGAWGGPDVLVEDTDKDGYDDWIDCDAQVADAHPGGTEVFYDGINQDCLSGSDYDADGDGHDADAYGGDDCDDADPLVVEGCPEEDSASPEDSGTPDTEDDPTPGGSGSDDGKKGCAHVSGGGAASGAALWLVLLGGLAGRRRREQ